MKKLQGALPWVGSKRQLRDDIIARIPEHTCYVEAFAGAAWVYLGKNPSPVEVLNDVNGNLTNLYLVLKEKPEAFYEALWFLLPSRELYSRSKDQLRQLPDRPTDRPDVERAALYFYHIKNAFGARFGSGFAFSRTRPPRHMVGADHLVELRERLQNTYIENLDFERLIKNYDAPGTFFYFDPPYLMGTPDKCYQHEFTMQDHERLRSAIENLKGKFILSYGDKKEIRDLYRGFRVERTRPINYTLSGKTVPKQELLISRGI